MLLICNDITDAYFNLACEEYLLKGYKENIFMVWRNERAVIIGRNQSAEREIDLEYAAAQDIKIVRRLTGGGAVYHDLGNINYTFIMRGSSVHFNDYRYFAAPIIDFLRKEGVEAEFSGRNDIIWHGAKISGTAQVMRGSDVLFHGTLLIDADLSKLSQVLKPDHDKLERHRIKSVLSRVNNLTDALKGSTAEELMERLMAAFSGGGNKRHSFSDGDIKAINALRQKKYSTDRWNFREESDED